MDKEINFWLEVERGFALFLGASLCFTMMAIGAFVGMMVQRWWL